MEQPDVRPGQIWADNDKRGYGRTVRVVEIVERHIGGRPSMGRGVLHAVVEQVSARDGYRPAGGRRTTIRLDRFRPTASGYRLVQDAPAQD